MPGALSSADCCFPYSQVASLFQGQVFTLISFISQMSYTILTLLPTFSYAAEDSSTVEITDDPVAQRMWLVLGLSTTRSLMSLSSKFKE